MNYPSDFTYELSKKPICGVLSVAMIAGCTFAEATKAIKNNMMPWQKRHGGKTNHEQRLGALKELGVKFIDHEVTSRKTLARVIEDIMFTGKTYMINMSSHVVTYKNGEVADQYEISHIRDHGSRRCFVRNITEIL